jgi:hypothetical protein
VAHYWRLSEKFYRFLQKHSFTSRVLKYEFEALTAGVIFTNQFFLMALPSPLLIESLRTTAERLRDGARYTWGRHGHCNCGNLAQTLTGFSAAEIERYNLSGAGEWTELAQDYCEVSRAPEALVLHKLMDAGLTPADVHNLEYLSDKTVLRHLPGGFRWLERNRREDVILYFETLADLLEQKLLDDAVREALAEGLRKKHFAASGSEIK